MIKGYLKIMILNILEEKTCSGYDIINHIGLLLEKKPSAGSVYPVLNELLEKNFITCKEDGRKKNYSITSKGKNEIKKILTEKREFEGKKLLMINSMNQLCQLSNKSSEKDFMKFMEAKYKLIISHAETWNEIRDVMIKLVEQKKFETNKGKIGKILKDATKELRRLLD